MVLRIQKLPKHTPHKWTIKLRDGRETIVDKENWLDLSQYSWFALKSRSKYYVVRRKTINGKTFHVMMHRQITHCPDGLIVHHINGDTFDNRRINLEIVTELEHRRYRTYRR